ncbi:MAG: hypothetical protein LBD91_05005 [Prevotellaceae bacterium]|jgi:hypothetical protein|nr:hypothetical protein [Prevotellaceae bacterium]
MEEIIIVPVIFITLYLIIGLFVHRKERLMIIERAAMNQSLDVNALLKKVTVPSFVGLKFGCLISGLGLGFLTCALLNILFYAMLYNYQPWWHGGALDIACILLFGGLGLIIAYVIERRAYKRKA